MFQMTWENFDQNILINAKREVLYNAFSTRIGMESWFLRSCEYSRNSRVLAAEEEAVAGDDYTFLWHGWPDETAEKGKIIAANGYDSFEFTFDGNGVTEMMVNISLKSRPDGTMVHLHQHHIPITEEGKYNWYVGCKTGWNFYLTNLKAILEHNVDLRNKDLNLKGVLNC